MATHEEALAVAEFYQRKPAMVHGKEVQLYLSREIAVIDVRLWLPLDNCFINNNLLKH